MALCVGLLLFYLACTLYPYYVNSAILSLRATYGMHFPSRKGIGQSRRFAKGKRRLAITIKKTNWSLKFVVSSSKSRKIISIYIVEGFSGKITIELSYFLITHNPVKVFALQIQDKIGGTENPETTVPSCT